MLQFKRLYPSFSASEMGRNVRMVLQSLPPGLCDFTPTSETHALKKTFPMERMSAECELSHFAQPETDRMWPGFALCMRAADPIHGVAGAAAREFLGDFI